MKKIAVIITVLAIFFSVSKGASALTTKSIFRTNGVAAFAEWYAETDGGYTDSFLSVMENQMGTDVYFGTCTYIVETEEFSCQDGYYFTTEDVFSIDKKLNTASLSPIEIELWDWSIEESEMVTLQASWSGFGAVEKGKFRVMSKYGNFMGKYNEQSRLREANATASLDGNDLGPSFYAGFVQFKSAEMIMEK